MRVLLIVMVMSFGLSFGVNAKEDLNLSLFNAVGFDDNGRSVIVDLYEIKKLLANGANPNWVNEDSRKFSGSKTPLSHYTYMSIMSRDETTDKYFHAALSLLFEYGVKVQKKYDGSVLFYTVAGGNYELTKILLYNGVSSKAWGKNVGTNLTPIQYASKEGFNDIVELLAVYGAESLDSKKAIQNKFVNAAKSESIEVLRELIEKGASINTKDDDNHTALINAVGLSTRLSIGMLQRVRFLLQEGADPNQEGEGTPYYSKPLHVAVAHAVSGPNVTRLKELLNLLIDSGALVSGRDSRKMTPLHWAATLNNPHAVQLLIDRHSKIMPKNMYDKTPLDYAESSEVIKILKENGAKEVQLLNH